MPTRVPDFYERFQCLAGVCPRSCCAGWEVVIDPETAAFYRTVPGTLGERLRAALTEREGELCFALDGGRCPFLDPAGLCEVHRALGEARTSRTCRSHPRFVEEYGPLREVSLAVSCPAACGLLLGETAPLGFRILPGDGEGAAPALLAPLLALRAEAAALLEDRRLPLESRLGWLLLLANEAQAALDEDRPGGLFDLGAAGDLPAALPVEGGGPGLFPAGWELLAGLEALEPDWRPLLAAARSGARPCLEADAPALERTAAYFLFRYLLKAVNDGDLLSRAKLAVFAVLAAARLAACLGGRLEEALSRFSREIEHSAENLAALLAALGTDGRFSLGRFFDELCV